MQLKIIIKEKFQAQFEERCADIVHNADGIGWGFYDELNELYHKYFPEDT
ncbi:MAG: hypothetical protein WCS37_02035 [Chloroflexota bacterium]